MRQTRKVLGMVKGMPTTDGAGVKLVRVLGPGTVEAFDPILMLDSFDSRNPEDYVAGFPMHPHRGIETISYLAKGKMMHRDSLGHSDTISDGEVQWMTAGSGILHEELLPPSDRMLGVQLWLNLPANDKMTSPKYRSIKNSEIPEVKIDGGKVRVLAGSFNGVEGARGRHLPFDYYDIVLDEGGETFVPTEEGKSVMLFTLEGSVEVEGETIEEKTAAKLSDGEGVKIRNLGESCHVLFMASDALGEPVAWGGPVVMNTREELDVAWRELADGDFVKHPMSPED